MVEDRILGPMYMIWSRPKSEPTSILYGRCMEA
jgi:hypothetical protein